MLFSELKTSIDNFNIGTISEERKQLLQPLVAFIQTKIENQQPINLNFICTHNSRRSHLSQLWAQAMAYHYNVKNVHCYSAGTEATALFTKVIEVLEAQGFQIEKLSEGENPLYAIKCGENSMPVLGFSKTLDVKYNPSSGFAAIMTCSQADAGCPFVPGAEKRIPITYEDPKEFDGTPQQFEKYLERSQQIATEMKYVFSQVQK